jgi:hypothetical protein
MKYHSFGKSAMTALLVTLLIGTTLGCSDLLDDPSLLRITITSPPTKTVYELGEALSISGLVVTGTYADGTTKTETVSLDNISGYNADATGTQTLTVTVGEKTATFTVTVNASESDAVLQSIAVTNPPTKTVYELSEPLDISGLAVTGTYSDGTTKTETVSLADISGYNADATGTQTLTVTVGGKTATFTVTIKIIAAFIVNMNLEDPINGIPENIVLSKTGTPASLILAIIGDYESYQWLLNDDETPVSTSASYTLNAADCRLGPNFLMVEVGTNNGAYYAREITFTVNK